LLQRLFLAVLQSVGPYLADRCAARMDLASQAAEELGTDADRAAQFAGISPVQGEGMPAHAHVQLQGQGQPLHGVQLTAAAFRRVVHRHYTRCVAALLQSWPKIRYCATGVAD
jgi:hypothetical protein